MRFRGGIVVALVLGVRCSGQAPPGSQDGSGPTVPAVGESPVDRPHVVFSVPLLNIDRLETPVMPPTSTGSRPSPATMASTAPDVVSVADTGHLVAHRNGRAVVRTLHGEGSELVVEVRAAGAISVRPARVELDPGASVALTLVAEPEGTPLPGSAARWASSAPAVASVLDGVIRASAEPGTARIDARYGGLAAAAEVTVRAPPEWRLTVSPEGVRMAAGAVRVFQCAACHLMSA